MVKKIGFVFLFSLFLSSVSFAQYREPEFRIIFHSAGFPIRSFFNNGFSNILNPLTYNITGTNPAALTHFNRFSAGMSFRYTTKIDSAIPTVGDKIGIGNANKAMPQSVGIVLPLRKFRFGMGFRQKYSASLDFGEIPIRTVQNPQGTGDTFSIDFETFVYSASGILAYSFENPLFNMHDISLGFQLDYDYLKESESILKAKTTAEDWRFNWKIGFLYQINETAKTAIVYQSSSSFSGTIKQNAGFITSNPDTFSNFTPVEVLPRFKGKLPAQLITGYAINIKKGLTFSGILQVSYWSQVSKNYRNQIDFSQNLLFPLSKKINATLGIYYSDRKYAPLEISYYNRDDKAVFLLAGVRVKIGNISIDGLIGDSHLFSSDLRKQSTISIGFSYFGQAIGKRS